MTSQHVRNKKYDTRRSRVAWLLFFTRCDVFSDLLQYTPTEKCSLFVLYNKNSNGLLKILRDVWGMEKGKDKSADVVWRHLCVSPLIDHGQQPMKMRTASRYCINWCIVVETCFHIGSRVTMSTITFKGPVSIFYSRYIHILSRQMTTSIYLLHSMTLYVGRTPLSNYINNEHLSVCGIHNNYLLLFRLLIVLIILNHVNYSYIELILDIYCHILYCTIYTI